MSTPKKTAASDVATSATTDSGKRYRVELREIQYEHGPNGLIEQHGRITFSNNLTMDETKAMSEPMKSAIDKVTDGWIAENAE